MKRSRSFTAPITLILLGTTAAATASCAGILGLDQFLYCCEYFPNDPQCTVCNLGHGGHGGETASSSSSASVSVTSTGGTTSTSSSSSTTSTGGMTGSGGSGGMAMVCVPGTELPCAYSGNPNQDGVGICKHGNQTCRMDGSGYDPCMGEVLPNPGGEICGNNLDDDCANGVDDGCSCTIGMDYPCYTGAQGTDLHPPCHDGTHTCTDGMHFGPCTGDQVPAAFDDCTTPIDENCDGVVNDLASGCVCTVGTQQACYSGAANTRNVGACHDGMQPCNPDGKGWGACSGDQLPAAADDCSNSIDEDCNGTYCTQPRWVDDFGGSSAPRSIAVDSNGNAYVAGQFTGNLPIGMNNLISSGGFDAFAAKVDPNGNVLWARQYGGANDQVVTDAAVDPAGNIVMVGFFLGSITFDGVNIINAQGVDFFVIKVDLSGNLVWAKVFNEGAGNGNASQFAYSVAVDQNSNIILTGTFANNLDFGAGHVLPGSGGLEFFLAKLKADGSTLWAFPAGDVGTHVGRQVRLDAAGNIVVVGDFANTMKFGATTLTASAGGNDVFVTRFDPAGQLSWGKSFGSTKTNYGNAVAVDTAGNVTIGGTFQGTLSFGGGNLVNPRTANNLFLAKFNSGGTYKWSTQLGSSVPANVFADTLLGVAADAQNNIYAVGSCGGSSFDLGVALSCGAMSTPYLIKLDSNAGLVFSRTYGANAGVLQAAASFSPSTLLVTGYNAGNMDLGSGPKASSSGADLIVSSIATN